MNNEFHIGQKVRTTKNLSFMVIFLNFVRFLLNRKKLSQKFDHQSEFSMNVDKDKLKIYHLRIALEIFAENMGIAMVMLIYNSHRGMCILLYFVDV